MAFDPNNTLREMRKLQLKMQRDYADPDGNGIDQDEALHMAALFESLDDHLSRAGYLPGPWAHNNNQIMQGIVQRPAQYACPYDGCTFRGTNEEVDDHRATGVHNDEPQAGSNKRV